MSHDVRPCVALAGGGTGGHIFPALAVAQELSTLGPARLVWIGARSRTDRDHVEARGIPYRAIPAGKLRRYFSLRSFLDPFKILAGVAASVRVLIRERPDVLFSKGGYVSVPPTLAAWLLRIPVVSHECDLTPGLATRINSHLSRRVHVSHPETVRLLGRAAPRARVSGNPVRAEIGSGSGRRAREALGVPPGMKVLLVVGGSLGASALNQAVAECRERLTRRFFVIHQRGRNPGPDEAPRYHSAPFFTVEYPDLLDAADLVVCRAGANSLAELSALGKPAVLVPLPLSSSRGDQIANAAHRSRSGAARVLSQANLSGETLARTVEELMDDPRAIETMGVASRAMSRPDAARLIARDLLDIAGPSRWRRLARGRGLRLVSDRRRVREHHRSG